MSPTFPPARRRALQKRLLNWFSANARDLPWRRDREPYRVWLAEVMLQQTRAEQAIPYFEKFLTRFPTISDLAAAPIDAVLKSWEGLGYYTRARHLHAAARQIMERYGGQFPQSLEEIRSLPGIGEYTAAAIASLAFGQNAAAVDGNVLRVLSRLTAYEGDIRRPDARRVLQAVAHDLLPRGCAGAFNEALMDLGATVCTPRSPSCRACPWNSFCAANAGGNPESYPRRKRRKKVPHRHVGAALVRDNRGRFLIARRRDGGMLGGLWEFPGGTREPGETIEQCIARELKEELGIEVEVGPHFLTVRHAFSHFTMDLHAHFCRWVGGRPRAIECSAWAWASLAEMNRYAFGRADLKIIEALRARERQDSTD